MQQDNATGVLSCEGVEKPDESVESVEKRRFPRTSLRNSLESNKKIEKKNPFKDTVYMFISAIQFRFSTKIVTIQVNDES